LHAAIGIPDGRQVKFAVERSEPPDLFWWDQVHASRRVIPQIDCRAMSRVAQDSSQLDVDVTFDPDTTNIKLVAR
jgi:hypothetical protein